MGTYAGISVSTALAQISTASILGKVVDLTGATVSGATVTATQVETLVNQTVSTGNDGLFNIRAGKDRSIL